MNNKVTGDERAFMADLNDIRDKLPTAIREQVIPALQQMANSIERFNDPRSCGQHQELQATWQKAHGDVESAMISVEVMLISHIVLSSAHEKAKPLALLKLQELDTRIVEQMVTNLFTSRRG